jgi:ADP-ribose pyrophosphatase YjhB (NUDIX family)
MDYKRYADLPRRVVISSPQKSGLRTREKKLISYGIMARVKDTNTWLMVKNRHSHALIFILYGAYQPVHLDELLASLTKNEHDSLKNIIINGLNVYMEYFKSVFNVNCSSVYGYYRLMDMDEEIVEYDKELSNNVQFSFPKGRRNPREDTIVTACRELYEETGLKETGAIIPTPISHTVEGLAGRHYTVKCWISEYNKIIPLEGITPIDVNEISDKDWININIDVNSPLDCKHYGYRGLEKVEIDNFSIKLIREAIKQGMIIQANKV